ncbi:MAG: hypothetical protein AB7N70_37720 [Dehalococcoidia bacterium]
MPYFDASKLKAPTKEYVAWIDVMGVQASMSRSIATTANFIYKLHIGALEAQTSGVRLYPVMDGVYATGRSQPEFLAFLRKLFSSLGALVGGEQEPARRFLVRGGLAFGAVYHGVDVPGEASPVLCDNPSYRDGILLGMPMVQANLVERTAPPFGIAVDASARGFSPTETEPLHVGWWHWKSAPTSASWEAMVPAVRSYFEWCDKRSLPIDYPRDRIDAHRLMFEQYVALGS